jgi:hypothetical protein
MRIKVLFIGNSFTARNNVPGMIAQLAGAQCKSALPQQKAAPVG